MTYAYDTFGHLLSVTDRFGHNASRGPTICIRFTIGTATTQSFQQQLPVSRLRFIPRSLSTPPANRLQLTVATTASADRYRINIATTGSTA